MKPLGIHTLDGNNIPEEDIPFYIAAKEGLFIRKSTAAGVAIVPAKELPKSLPYDSFEFAGGVFYLSATKIPVKLFNQILGFFIHVYNTQDTEAEVLLTYNPDTKDYGVIVPKQEVTSVSVNHKLDPTEIPTGYLLAGSIHSHCDMDAFHSGTDTNDASDFNGIHITVGRLNNKSLKFDYAFMVTFNGLRFEYTIEQIVDIDKVTPAPFPKKWFDRLEQPKPISLKPFWLDDDYNNEPKGKKGKKSKDKISTRWSVLFKKTLPTAWFGKDGEISTEFVIDAAEDALNYLNEMLSKEYDLGIKWALDFKGQEISTDDAYLDGDYKDVARALLEGV